MKPFYFFSFLLILCVACERDDYRRFEKQMDQFVVGYSSPDITTAEIALLEYKNELEQFRARGTNFNKEWKLGYVNARLSYLNHFKGENVASERYFIVATNHLAAAAEMENRSEHVFTHKDILDLVEKMDTQLEVKWKTNALEKQTENNYKGVSP